MPIPQRTPGEGRDEYVGRCISELSSEYPQDQASAICYLQLAKTRMAEETPEISPADIEQCMLELQGINPSYSGPVAYKICVDRLTVAARKSAEEDAGIGAQ